jgi:hypothetical protein
MSNFDDEEDIPAAGGQEAFSEAEGSNSSLGPPPGGYQGGPAVAMGLSNPAFWGQAPLPPNETMGAPVTPDDPYADTHDFVAHPNMPAQYVDPVYANSEPPPEMQQLAQSKLGKFLSIIAQAGQGALAGQAAAEHAVVASGGHSSGGIGTGFMGAMQAAQQQRMAQAKLGQVQATTQMTQQKAAAYPQDRAMWRQRMDALTGLAVARAQSAGHKVLKVMTDDQGQVSVFSQHPNGEVVQQQVGKIRLKPQLVPTGGGAHAQWNPDSGNWLPSWGLRRVRVQPCVLTSDYRNGSNKM